MSDRFRRATEVEVVEGDGEGGRVRYSATVRDGWDIGGNANGGYLLAIAGRAMTDAVGRPPLTVTCHYLRPAPAGSCELEVEIVRVGRRLATASATLTQEGRPVLRLLGSFGERQAGGPSLVSVNPFDVPAFDDCIQRPHTAESPSLMANLNCRIHPADAGFADGTPSGRAEVRGWFDLADAEPIDAIGLLLAADAFPPPIFNTEIPVAWVPTVELTVHIRGLPTTGPLRVRFVSEVIGDGLLSEDGVIWDSAGNLVAQSRQLALTPRSE